MKHEATLLITLLLAFIILNNSIPLVKASSVVWLHPTGYEDPDSDWYDETKAYDGSISTRAYENSIPSLTWGKFLVLTIYPITTDRVRFYATARLTSLDLDIYVNDSWIDVYQGIYSSKVWTEKTFTSGNVTKARVRFLDLWIDFVPELWEFEFYGMVDYIYSFYGAYYENGTSTYQNTTITAIFLDSTSYSFVLNGSYTYVPSSQPSFFRWNIGTLERTYYVTGWNQTINVFTPEASYGLYQFSIQDYAGMIDSTTYLYSYRIINDTQYVLEKRNVKATVNKVPLVMTVGASYLLVLNNSLTEYSFGYYTAGATTTDTLTVYSIDFPSQTKLTYQYIWIDASRSEDNTFILVNYQTVQGNTSLVQLWITFKNGTTTYYANSTSQTVQFQWDQADNMTNYLVYVNADHSILGTVTFRKTLPYYIDVNPPFNLSPLGTWGIPATQVVPFLIIIAVAVVFSAVTVPLGLIMTVITAGILRYIGWVTFTGTLSGDAELLGIIGSLAIMYALYKARRKEG